MVPAGLRGAVCLVALILTATMVGVIPVSGGTMPTDTSERPSSLSSAGRYGVELPANTSNNSTRVPHVDPDDIDTSGDLAALERWFARQLSSQLEASVRTLSQGEYRQAKELLGDRYTRQLDRYVDVAGATDDPTDDRTGEQFAAAQKQQQTYISVVKSYRETHQQYQNARRAGNETRARMLARKLSRLATRVNQTNTTLVTQYRRLENTTRVDLSTARQTITQTTANISTQQVAVRRETFVQTTVVLTHQSPTASFQSPMELSGVLTTANGTALPNRTLIAQFGTQTIRIQTNQTGAFTLTSRPTLIPRGQQTVTVRYVPQNTSIYLGTTTRVPVTVTPVTPTITLAHTPQTVGFNDTVTVTGRVHAGNVGATDVPVQIRIGDTVLATTRTTPNGTFTIDTSLPAAVPSGDQQLHVSLPMTDRALATTTTTAPLTVTTTATRLTITETQQTANHVQLHGTLQTTAGLDVPHQPIAIRIDGRTVTTTTTNGTGGYTATLPASTLTTQQTTNRTNVTVVYPGAGNLQPARTTTLVHLPTQNHTSANDGIFGSTTPLSGEQGWQWQSLVPWLIVALLGCTTIGLLTAYRKTIREYLPTLATVITTTTLTDQPTDTATSSDVTEEEEESTATATPVKEVLLAQATEQQAAGDTNAAVRTAYTAVRRHIITTCDVAAAEAATRTHWEFYRGCQQADAVPDHHVTVLKEVTEAFEQARFTTGIKADVAASAITTARTLLTPADHDTAERPEPPTQ